MTQAEVVVERDCNLRLRGIATAKLTNSSANKTKRVRRMTDLIFNEPMPAPRLSAQGSA
jgi:hypothetical protein